MGKPLVIDADGHVNEVGKLARMVELVQGPVKGRIKVDPQNPLVMLIDGKPWPSSVGAGAPMRVRGGASLSNWHEQPERYGMWDPKKRVQDMDTDGIDIAVLFPGRFGLGGPGHAEREVATAIVRAYNDWLHEYCAAYPDRLRGVTVLAAQDVEASVAELRRCVTEYGYVGGTMSNWNHVSKRNLDDAAYEPLWTEAERLGVPLCIHNQGAVYSVLQERFTTYLQRKPINDPTENMLASQAMIFGGVFDRHPKLRVAFLEGGAGWIPFWIDRLHEYYEEFLEGSLKRGGPEAYFRSEQCYFSFELEERTLGYVSQMIGADRLLFATDYLHHDAKFPGSTEPVRFRHDLSREDKVKVLGGNAAAFYGLPRER
ncbi:MAG: amidohydrolase [Dehalococcoidia bacterium]|nr:amidohydrolase [Dehalococcoidia bacterium]